MSAHEPMWILFLHLEGKCLRLPTLLSHELEQVVRCCVEPNWSPQECMLLGLKLDAGAPAPLWNTCRSLWWPFTKWNLSAIGKWRSVTGGPSHFSCDRKERTFFLTMYLLTLRQPTPAAVCKGTSCSLLLCSVLEEGRHFCNQTQPQPGAAGRSLDHI